MKERQRMDGYRGMVRPGHRGDRSRYPILYMVNPWTPQEEAERALMLRGAILAAWGTVETTLSEVALRCSVTPEYGEKGRTEFPHRLKSRFSYLREVLGTQGPLWQYRRFGLAFLAKFESYAEVRHIMAHARMTILPKWGVTFVEIHNRNGSLVHSQERISIDQLEHLAIIACRLSRISQRMIGRIDAEGLLARLPAGDS